MKFSKIIKICYVALLVLTSLGYLRSFSQDPVITIFEPKNDLITHKERVVVKGKIPSAKSISLNGVKLNVGSNGAFKAVLILHPGKNFLEAKAKVNGREVKKNLRILRIIKYPDMEQLYKGRNHWARKDVTSMSTLGIVEGYPDSMFRPKKVISRGEFATWIARAKDLHVKDLIEDVFFDVPKEHWRAPHVKAVVDVGYMKSNSSRTFGIGSQVARGKAAQVIGKIENFSIPSRVNKAPFLDVAKDHPNATAIYAAFHGKMVIGVSKTKKIYEPDRSMNRAEATILLSRINKIREKLRLLYDFSKGYDRNVKCKINTPPTVSEASVVPSMISTKSRLLITFTVKVSDMQGIKDISEVKINLTPIKGPPNAVMYDDGTHDDEKAGDGRYTLRIGIEPGVEAGEKQFKVFVTDKSGWAGSGKIKLTVMK